MDELRKMLRIALSKDLPAEEAHRLMMNYKRMTPAQAMAKEIEHRLSAVLILLFPRENTCRFLLLKRHDYEGHHSGQVGLPGGKMDIEDKDLLSTALRECREESGIAVDAKDVIGELSPIFIPPSRFMVHPFVAVLDTEPTFTFDEYEVRFGIEAPLEELMHADSVKAAQIQTAKFGPLDVKGFYFDNELVWGATAMMLMELRTIIEGQTGKAED